MKLIYLSILNHLKKYSHLINQCYSYNDLHHPDSCNEFNYNYHSSIFTKSIQFLYHFPLSYIDPYLNIIN
jgi:hypothetical protein